MSAKLLKVSIVGAGFSGLSMAYALHQQGFAVEVYEKSDHVGGLLQTKKTEYGLVEPAANAFIASAELEKLCQKIGVELLPVLPTAKKRFLFRRGKMHRWPLNIFESFGMLLKILWALCTGRLAPQHRQGKFETVAQWGRRVLGKTATSFLLAPALQGIYAGDIESMQAELIISPLFKKRGSSRGKLRGSVSLKNGMRDFCRRLFETLQRSGVKFYFSQEISLQKFAAGEIVIVATSAQAASQLLRETDPALASAVAQIRKANVVSVTRFFTSQESPEGFGCLFSPREGMNSLGVLMNHNIFSGRIFQPNVQSQTWILGGILNSEILQKTDAEILALLAEDQKKLFPAQTSAATELQTIVSRWPEVLPHYDSWLADFLQQYAKRKNQSLYLTGNYVGNLGLSKILAANLQLARQLKDNSESRS